VKVALAGYKVEHHEGGVYLVSLLTGQRTFREWRQWRSLRPLHDPDLPRHVDALDRFAARWHALALQAAEAVADDDDRRDLKVYLDLDARLPTASRTWRAKSLTARIRGIGGIPWFSAAWAVLVSQGIEVELVSFEAVLREVQAFIRDAPLASNEIEEMHRAREGYDTQAREWLDGRRAQLASLGPRDLDALGLGPRVPLSGFEPSLAELSTIAFSGLA
jgi:hypothetical protein